jgi:hypothetical protein
MYQGTLVAVFFTASQGLPFSRLIVARAIPIASRAFATVAIQRSVKGAAVLATAIVVNTTTTMAPISAVDNVVASIVAKSSLAFGTLTAPAVGGLAEPSAELLRASQRGHLLLRSASWRSIVPTRRLALMSSSDACALGFD